MPVSGQWTSLFMSGLQLPDYTSMYNTSAVRSAMIDVISDVCMVFVENGGVLRRDFSCIYLLFSIRAEP